MTPAPGRASRPAGPIMIITMENDDGHAARNEGTARLRREQRGGPDGARRALEMVRFAMVEDGEDERRPGATFKAAIAQIIIGSRHRRDFGDLAGLAASISAEGLLQPIGVTADRTLVFGERRLRACRDVLGWTEIDARTVDVTSIVAGEYAENEVRKDFTPSERVAIAEAVRQDFEGRHGGDRTGVQAGPRSLLVGRSRDFAAQRAGFGSGKQLERAEKVVRLGVPALVEEMDRGEMSIRGAETVARADAATQSAVVALDPPARLDELRRLRETEARIRASAAEQEARTGPTAYTGFLRKNGRLPTADEAGTLATLDARETPDAAGKRHPPGPPPTAADRLSKRQAEAYRDQLWRTREALALLALNTDDPATLIPHAGGVEAELMNRNLVKARKWLNAFAQEWKRHGK